MCNFTVYNKNYYYNFLANDRKGDSSILKVFAGDNSNIYEMMELSSLG